MQVRVLLGAPDFMNEGIEFAYWVAEEYAKEMYRKYEEETQQLENERKDIEFFENVIRPINRPYLGGD